MIETLLREISLDCPVEHAFHVFTEMVNSWWPHSDRKYADGRIALAAHPGGMLVETSPQGPPFVFGTVTRVEPPYTLEMDWRPGSPQAPTRVIISFVENDGGTRILIRHQPIAPEARKIWPERVSRFATGWDSVLAALAAALSDTASHHGDQQ